MSDAPKVFISHATEDKAAFAIPFATELRKNGIDAWIDEWEIRAGDSLVQKIFEEGIRHAAVIVVVLSKTSVSKKWVREELDAALVKRIAQAARLIPIVIEDCDVPVALQATKRIHYKAGEIKVVVDEVVRAVFGTSDKPSLGQAPNFTRTSIPSLPGLDQIDAVVLDTVGEVFLEQGHKFVSKQKIIEKLHPMNLSVMQIDESLGMLTEHYFVTGTHAIGAKFVAVELQMSGANVVLRHRFPDLDDITNRIISALINDGVTRSDEIATRLSLKIAVVNHVFDDLEARGLIKMAKSINGPYHVFDVSVRLKRSLN